MLQLLLVMRGALPGLRGSVDCAGGLIIVNLLADCQNVYRESRYGLRG